MSRENSLALSVRGLSKAYPIAREAAAHSTLAESALARLRRPFRRRASTETFWALRDVDFEVRRGEVVGIIGRNGAGKSTLLKILSRITEPTDGQAELYGRVGSLLEVGTGFHPELTGRENIYLNGQILGMRRAEIDRQFDAIVAFAEVEKFLDTPVKRYSSGMYVRLAFAVAAHLNPEILIVDEVLAVGDAEFQKRCLGKMRDVTRLEGRTVLFVSHNMQAVQSLCTRALMLQGGQVEHEGEPHAIVQNYLSATTFRACERRWSRDEAPGAGGFRLLKVSVAAERGEASGLFSTGYALTVEFEFDMSAANPALCVGFDLMVPDGSTVLRTYQTDRLESEWPTVHPGRNRWQCRIPQGLLNAGTYLIAPRVGLHGTQWLLHAEPVLTFEAVLGHGVSPLWAGLDHRSRPGCVAPIFRWSAIHGDDNLQAKC